MPNSPDLTQFKVFTTIEDDATNQLQQYINHGWSLISVGVKRNTEDYDNGQFRDEFIYLLGRAEPME